MKYKHAQKQKTVTGIMEKITLFQLPGIGIKVIGFYFFALGSILLLVQQLFSLFLFF
ncbi:hypothetical protein SAMN02745724_04813 [Pseudoalteromonas denitrificans DSM 6059]|uniref:Uncharacterized protein n=1 Tax=Pseudoalteromonas denitrificans DSM 6059 TaxID=1123010 RepID=A0A1I1T859_9GAMM|nr:hypothetical protein SAMN02745724_04813 [Pseudoalteromonas denitrificans DSM 6059]